VDEIAQAEAAAIKEGEDVKAEAEEVGDEVEALKSDAGEQEKPQDVLSLAPSRRSNATSKTYISKLEKQLEAEKQARLKLEYEVEEMKKINAEISSKLGLSSVSPSGKAEKQ